MSTGVFAHLNVLSVGVRRVIQASLDVLVSISCACKLRGAALIPAGVRKTVLNLLVAKNLGSRPSRYLLLGVVLD